MDDRGSISAVNGRARGVIVGSLFALGWASYGASVFRPDIRDAALGVSVAVTAALLFSAFAMLRRARSLPPATSEQTMAARRARRWFWLNLLGEVVLLNIAINLLGAPDLHVFWIAAISGIVGLHFLPMAVFFRARSYWFVGGAMMIGAIVSAVFVGRYRILAADIACIEALANAVILWSSLAVAAARRPATPSDLVEPSRRPLRRRDARR